MNVKKRLIKLFKKIEYTPFPEMTTKANLANQFTDYALNCIVDEMLANGVIAPPCKPGDKIYFPSYYKSGIRCGVVERIILDSKGMLIDVGYMKIDAGSFGVSVFTDYNEALRALEKEKLENEVRK